MLCRLNGKVEIHPKFGVYLQDLRLILKKRLLYLIGFAANTGNSSRSHTFNQVKLDYSYDFPGAIERALPFKYKLLIGEIVKPHQTSLPGLLGLPPTILLCIFLY